MGPVTFIAPLALAAFAESMSWPLLTPLSSNFEITSPGLRKICFAGVPGRTDATRSFRLKHPTTRALEGKYVIQTEEANL